jgi:hypothetical protein
MGRSIYVFTGFVATVFLSLTASVSFGGGLPEKCRLEPVNGPCKAMLEKYYFNQKTSRCMEYIYDGCGPVVPFETIEECRSLCETVATSGEGAKTPGVKKRSGLACDPVEADPR